MIRWWWWWFRDSSHDIFWGCPQILLCFQIHKNKDLDLSAFPLFAEATMSCGQECPKEPERKKASRPFWWLVGVCKDAGNLTSIFDTKMGGHFDVLESSIIHRILGLLHCILFIYFHSKEVLFLGFSLAMFSILSFGLATCNSLDHNYPTKNQPCCLAHTGDTGM